MLRIALIAVFAISGVGCAALGPSTSALVLAAAMLLLLAPACFEPVSDRASDAGAPDAGRDGSLEGTWEMCCVDGRLTTCHCPPRMACNYGMGLKACADGGCVNAFASACPGEDAGRDAGDTGTWSACCKTPPDGGRLGELSSCYCPPLAACNYGMGLRTCPDGRCYNGIEQPDSGICG